MGVFKLGLFDRFFAKKEPEQKSMTIEQAIDELKKSIKVDEFSPTFGRVRRVKKEAHAYD
jgi:hypothetical protein